jgi:two-component system, cell cycle response regulator DivK
VTSLVTSAAAERYAMENDVRQLIMVVDDCEDIRELVALQLTLLGYRVMEATNGFEAFELARKECPALILMDINMPILDGLAATRCIREVEETCDVIIVAFSALGSGDNRARALEAGCDEFITKPMEMTRLSNLMTNLLSSA